MAQTEYREAIVEYIRLNARPPDKFSHQARLYFLAKQIAAAVAHDEDVLYASAWLHDLGVFIGHRPEEPRALAAWDWIAYAMEKAPALLDEFGFPKAKIPSVLEAIRTHLPSAEPTTIEGSVLRDADILEQLGAVGILRTVSKVGRDTRFPRFSDALRILQKNLEQLPGKLRLESARQLAQPRVQALRAFLAAAEAEGSGIEW
jgi:uncharacterized protein